MIEKWSHRKKSVARLRILFEKYSKPHYSIAVEFGVIIARVGKAISNKFNSNIGINGGCRSDH
ncbi:hypothetical protein NBRC116583_10970 [Arenicella sp. 4NH20-0111]